ncbi:nucleophosmin-like [Ambystoma mexicanum]|uniref:nucleophosmin-like n=1 Tax=Ambystoma mexicanum TaxID=8296 RepID=UPI0037E7F22E
MEVPEAAVAPVAPLHMETEESETPLRTHSFLFGCMLKGAKTKVSFPGGGGDDLREQVTLRTVSLGPDAPDVLHVLAVIGETQEGSLVRVPVATLRPSLLTCVHLGGLELTPPVTFWLTAGTGPLYISGQHLVALTESEAEAAKAAAKREAAAQPPAAQTEERLMSQRYASAGPPPPETPTLEQMKEKLVALSSNNRGAPSKHGGIPTTLKKFRKFAASTLGTDVPRIVQQLWQFVRKEELNEPPAPRAWDAPLTVEQMKDKLLSLSLKRGSIPRTMAAFQTFAYFTFRTCDPRILRQLWEFVLREKLHKPPTIGDNTPSLAVEHMKEALFSISVKRGGIPDTFKSFRKFVHFTFGTGEVQVVQHLWEFVLREQLNKPSAPRDRDAPLTVEQRKEKLVSLSKYGIPTTMEKFRNFAASNLGTNDPRVVQHLWEFVLSEKLNERPRVHFWQMT